MKRLVKSLILRLLGMVIRDRGSKVIYYHDVGAKYTKMGTPSDLFWAHIRAAKKAGWTFVSSFEFRVMSFRFEKIEGGVAEPANQSTSKLANIVSNEVSSNLRLRRSSAVTTNSQQLTVNNKLLLCFDDGFRGIWDERERFREEGLRPTVFIPVSLVGIDGYLTWDEIKILQDEYGFDFQSHTWSNQTLAGSGIEKLRGQEVERDDVWFERELLGSKRELEERLGKTIDSICFPAGMFSKDVLARCLAAGYNYLFTSYPGVIDDIALHRLATNIQRSIVIPRNLCQFSSISEFKSILCGALVPLAKRYQKMHITDGS